MYKIMDGNEACSYVSYNFAELAAIYPITPASPMAEYVDKWANSGKVNFFGEKVDVVEMESEAGAIASAHGALQNGILATTYTASQGSTRWPLGPTQAPMGSTSGSLLQTAILVRLPASRAMERISTVPSYTVIYAAVFAVISGILGMFGQTLLAFCTAGALLGFLMWNFPPAKVFMGDI